MEKLQINLTPNLSTLNSTVKILIFFSNYLSMKTRSRVQRHVFTTDFCFSELVLIETDSLLFIDTYGNVQYQNYFGNLLMTG